MARFFRDSAGDGWNVNINPGTAVRLREECGIDVNAAEVHSFDIASDRAALLAALWVMLRAEAGRRGIAFAEFVHRFESKQVFDEAGFAFLGCIVDYWPADMHAAGNDVLKKLRKAKAEIDGL